MGFRDDGGEGDRVEVGVGGEGVRWNVMGAEALEGEGIPSRLTDQLVSELG